MKSFMMQTRREKAGTTDGLNLFFGALLGANLGTLDALDIQDYCQITIMLAGTVMALRMVSTSERRVYALATLALYGALILALLLIPDVQPEGMAKGDLHRLGATVVIWIFSILILEIWPMMSGTALSPDEEEAA